MSNQSENEIQQTPTPTPEEVRQHLLTEIEASKQTIEELSDEELEQIAGGHDFSFHEFFHIGHNAVRGGFRGIFGSNND